MKKWILGGLKAIVRVGGHPLIRTAVMAVPGGVIIERVIAAATAIEEAGTAFKGADKENAAVKIWQALEAAAGDLGDDEKVEAAIRKAFQAYVAVKNAEAAFADAAEAVRAAVDDVRQRRAGAVG